MAPGLLQVAHRAPEWQRVEPENIGMRPEAGTRRRAMQTLGSVVEQALVAAMGHRPNSFPGQLSTPKSLLFSLCRPDPQARELTARLSYAEHLVDGGDE